MNPRLMKFVSDKIAWVKRTLPALYLAFRHKDTPWYAKTVAIIAVVYAISPIDLIPDVIPVLGYLDDLLILPILIALAIRWIPHQVMKECLERSEHLNLPKGRWYHAIPILMIWVVIMIWIVGLIR